MKHALGIDIGGTNSRISLFNSELELISKTTILTDPNDSEKTISEICDYINLLKESHKIVGIGTCAPGPLDLKAGKILESPNLPGWSNYELAKEIELRTDIPVRLENDANLAAYAEAKVGLGAGLDVVQFLTISTGVGSGLVINGQIYNGAHGFAHEIANIIVDPSGHKKDNLQKGSVESIGSGTAITTIARMKGLDVKHAGEVNDLALEGNPIAIEVMNNAYDALSSCIAGIVALIDPNVIILSGSVALKIDGFVEKLEELVKSKVFDCVKPHVKIVKSNLDGDSGILGAALIGFTLENK